MAYYELNEQELGRRESLAKLRELGINPYPAPLYPINTTTVEIAEGFKPEEGNFQDVCIAGRIMSRRIMGAASFMELQDSAGRIQVYVKRDEICPGEDKTMYNTVFKKLLDIGDIIGIKGFAFFTQTGQLSVHAKELTVLSKSLRVLPIVKTDADGTVHERDENVDDYLAQNEITKTQSELSPDSEFEYDEDGLVTRAKMAERTNLEGKPITKNYFYQYVADNNGFLEYVYGEGRISFNRHGYLTEYPLVPAGACYYEYYYVPAA